MQLCRKTFLVTCHPFQKEQKEEKILEETFHLPAETEKQKPRSRNHLQNSYFQRISSLDIMEFVGPVKKGEGE